MVEDENNLPLLHHLLLMMLDLWIAESPALWHVTGDDARYAEQDRDDLDAAIQYARGNGGAPDGLPSGMSIPSKRTV